MDSSISYTKTENREEAYQSAKKSITAESLAKFKVNPTMTYDDDAKSIKAKGKGFELNASFTETECQIDISLGLLLKALKSKILGAVEREFGKFL